MPRIDPLQTKPAQTKPAQIEPPQIEPLQTLYDSSEGVDLPLPTELAALYGHLSFTTEPGRAHVVANFVSTLDGVTVIQEKRDGGGAISGYDARDRMVMGLLRAAADAVVVGAGTLRAGPKHIWTAEQIYPGLADEYRRLRSALGKTRPPLNVVVSGSGKLDLGLRVFSSGEVPSLIVTGEQGARRLREAAPPSVAVAGVGGEGRVSAGDVLEAVANAGAKGLVLVEGGPHLLGDFLAERVVDELFLTLAPQVAGRDGAGERPGFVAGRRFLPDDPRWSSLVSVKRGGSHLFLRYGFG